MEKKIRVCFVSYMFSPIVGGSEVQAEKQARFLRALGHEVTIITLRMDRRWKRQELLNGLPVVRVGGLFRREGQLHIGRIGQLPIEFALFLTLWRLRHQYDVIHLFQLSHLAWVAALVGKMTQKQVIINIQSAGPNDIQRMQLQQKKALMADTLTDTNFLTIDPGKSWLIGGGDIDFLYQTAIGGHAIVNFLRKSSAFYQTLSTRSTSYLISHGFRAEQIVCIPNGVDTEKFRPDPEKRPDSAKPERVIVCVARLAYPKGVDVLLHAWGRMMREEPQWRSHLKLRLCLVGDGEFRPQMERIVAELGIQESVQFLGLSRDITDLLQRSWGFVLPSRWEGMPNALLEAMACALPCVATRVSGSEDIISDGVDGLLVEPEQPVEMANALHHIIEDAELAHRLGWEGRRTMVRLYRLTEVVEQCITLYRSLLFKHKNDKEEASTCHLPFMKRMRGARER